MPLPLILGAAAAVAATAGAANAYHGVKQMKDAKDTMRLAESCHKQNIERYEIQNNSTSSVMDMLGTKELEICKSFGDFSDVFEKIHNRPEFKEPDKSGDEIPKFDNKKLKEVSIGAGVLLGGIGGAAVGTAGGFAAAGVTTSAVMALGTASTGTAIASLSGAAATNATLAALGGGAIAAGGGGIALGSAVLGAATLGVGMLVGGIIFNITGSKISDKADESWEQMKKAEEKINMICLYLNELEIAAKSYIETLLKVNKVYSEHFRKLRNLVIIQNKKDWNYFTKDEKTLVENTILLVNLLYRMCTIAFVKQNPDKDGLNEINYIEIDNTVSKAKICLNERKFYSKIYD